MQREEKNKIEASGASRARPQNHPMILALALTVLSRSQTPNWIVKAEATGFTYVSTDAGEYGIDGVCTIQTNTVTCWRPDGTRDTALDAQADAMLLGSTGT